MPRQRFRRIDVSSFSTCDETLTNAEQLGAIDDVARRWLHETNEESPVYLPLSLVLILLRHFVRIARYRDGDPPPLLLLITGPPGVGKTVMLDEFCRRMHIHCVTWRGAEFESCYAGEPIHNFERLYVQAGRAAVERSTLSCIRIDDLDLAIGVHEHFNDGTTNLMHAIQAIQALTDNPTNVRGISCKPVAIVASANDPSALRRSITRPGRCRSVKWDPSLEERDAIARHILRDVLVEAQRDALIMKNRHWSAAQFADLKIALLDMQLDLEMGRLSPPEYLRAALRSGQPHTRYVRVSDVRLARLVDAIDMHGKTVAERHI
jgi:DNA polymerase III delta prime subunit